MTNVRLVEHVYGPAEITIACATHLIECDYGDQQTSVPIGRLLPRLSLRAVLDEFSVSVAANQAGELTVGGCGVFAGYLGRDDLTEKVLININGELFYRTGDLVRYDNDGLLYYVGRKDHQVKLHGQRIELGEIERCLLDCSSHVSACVVTKYGDHHLIAYVQSDDIEENVLHDYCRSHLPPFMIPSIFIILKQLPLNTNGKLDRKALPSPDFSTLSSSSFFNQTNKVYSEPSNEIEMRIHTLWCELLQCTRVSTTESIFQHWWSFSPSHPTLSSLQDNLPIRHAYIWHCTDLSISNDCWSCSPDY